MNIWSGGLACVCSGSAAGDRGGFVCERRGLGADRYGAQYGVGHCCQRRALRAVFAVAIVALAVRSVFETYGSLRVALATALLVWGITAMVATVEESRTTWLLMR